MEDGKTMRRLRKQKTGLLHGEGKVSQQEPGREQGEACGGYGGGGVMEIKRVRKRDRAGRGKERQNEVRGFVRPVVGGSNKAC